MALLYKMVSLDQILDNKPPSSDDTFKKFKQTIVWGQKSYLFIIHLYIIIYLYKYIQNMIFIYQE